MQRALSFADNVAGQMAMQVLAGRVWPDTAAALHAQAARALSDAGFAVFLEFMTAPLGDDRNGRIDIVAKSARGGWVAIEIDNRRPKRRSLVKLGLFPGFRLVALRGIDGHETPDGVDNVIGLRVRLATPAERRDKRTIRRPE